MFIHKIWLLLVLLGVPCSLGEGRHKNESFGQTAGRDELKSAIKGMQAKMDKLNETLYDIKKEQNAVLSAVKYGHNTTWSLLKQFLVPTLCSQGMNAVPKYVRIHPLLSDVIKRPYLCDTKTDGGGWIVIMRRMAGINVSFDRQWEDYRQGFGNDKTFWMGNEQIHAITNDGKYEVRFELKANKKSPATVTYNHFSVGSEEEKYKLEISGFRGDIFDGMKGLNGRYFTTRDQDNDRTAHSNCASYFRGGWWLDSCGDVYLTLPFSDTKGYDMWKGFDSNDQPLNYVEMKIRRHKD